MCYEGVAKENSPKSNRRRAERDMLVERDEAEKKRKKKKKKLKKSFYKWSSISGVMIRGGRQSGIEMRHALGMKRTVTAVKLDFLTAIEKE